MIRMATQKIIESSAYVEDASISVPDIIKRLEDISYIASTVVEFLKITSPDIQSAQKAALKASTDAQGLITLLRGGKPQ